ncbi:MAG: PDZ domain-containing protein [Acidobacteriota bacterium]
MEDTRKPNPRYVAILAGAACVILAVGWLARPAEVAQHPVPLPSETELEQLARRAERRSLDSMTKYFAGAARDVESSIGRVRDARMSGIAWTDGVLVTGPLAGGPGAQAPVAVAAPFGEAEARPDIVGPHLPLATLQGPAGLAGLVPVRRAERPPAAGDWMIAVWRTDTEPAFAAGNFRQLEAVACGVMTAQELGSSLSFTGAMVGGGVFNIDGELLGMVLPCGERVTAIAAASIESMLARENTVDERIRGRYGVVVAPLSVDEAAYFKRPGGLLVREIWTGSAAEAAGLRPGDIVIALGARAVGKIEDLQPLTDGTEPSPELKVQRGAKSLSVNLASAAAAPGGASGSGAGLTLASGSDPYRIVSVQPGSPAAQAGLQPGDRLVRIDFAAPRSPDQVRKLFAAARPSPLWLEVDRDAHRIGILLQ